MRPKNFLLLEDAGALVSNFHQFGNLEANCAFFLLWTMFYNSVCLYLVYRQCTIGSAVALT